MIKKTEHSNKSRNSYLYTRRRFMQTTLGGAAMMGLLSCDTVEDGLEMYTGPEINELDFVAFNGQYINNAMDVKTGFPHNAIKNGALSGFTDPIAIAYRLQRLVDIGDEVGAELLLDNLLVAQENSISFIDYRGFIPRLEITGNTAGFTKADPDFRLADNAALSARVAMVANAFDGATVAAKAQTFLNNQKEGYNFYLNGNGTGAGLPITGSALNADIDNNVVDLLFSDFYAEIAFVMSYFIGDSATIQDPQVGLDAWDALVGPQAIPTGQHGDSFTALTTLTVPLSKNGSGYQYFQPLLAIPTESIGQPLADALYNVLFSFLDAARFENLPGIYSGGPNAQGNFLSDNGLSRLAVTQNASTARESLLTVDALAAALRLFPTDSTERQTIRRWIGVFNETPGIQGTSGLFGSVDKAGNVANTIYARQNASMVLFDSTAPNNLEAFLAANGKTSLADMFARIAINHDSLPVQRVPADLPNPPPLDQIFPTTPTEDGEA